MQKHLGKKILHMIIFFFFFRKKLSLYTVKILTQNSLYMQEINLLTFSSSRWLLLPMTATSPFSMLPMNLLQHEDNPYFLLRFNRQQAITRSHLFSEQAALIEGATTDGEKYTRKKKRCVWAMTFRCGLDSSQIIKDDIRVFQSEHLSRWYYHKQMELKYTCKWTLKFLLTVPLY